MKPANFFYKANYHSLLLGLLLILVSGSSFAKQGTFALVAPFLDYSALGDKHPATSLARFSYSAFRSGLADHSLQLNEQSYSLSFKEASPPSKFGQANLERFYQLSAKEKDAWIKKQKVTAIIWLELPSNLDKALKQCKIDECNLPYRINIQFPKSLIYSYESKAPLNPKDLTLGQEAQKQITNTAEDFVNNLWNNCATKTDKKVYPPSICGKKAKPINNINALVVQTLDQKSFDLRPLFKLELEAEPVVEMELEAEPVMELDEESKLETEIELTPQVKTSQADASKPSKKSSKL